MFISKKIAWHNPLNLVQKVLTNYQQNLVFLYSGLWQQIANSKSFLALFPLEKMKLENFSQLDTVLQNNQKTWFGYFSYENISDLENISFANNFHIKTPAFVWQNFGLVLEFNHSNNTLLAKYQHQKYLDFILECCKKDLPSTLQHLPKAQNITANLNQEQYLQAILDIQQKISAGDLFQTNLTQKFSGLLNENINHSSAFSLFAKLMQISPANYASFAVFDETFIVSASPELFLQAKNKQILTKPIKGTIASKDNQHQDLEQQKILQNSNKDKAENLMITDLMRNDLAKVCVPKSVEVPKLFELQSYKNLHHLVSSVVGKLAKKYNYGNLIKACFPPGSMTGAPKLEAIKVAHQHEQQHRGIYSGCLGFIAKNQLNLSVVIRTLILQQNKFEFQAGGGITSASDPLQEVLEVKVKSSALTTLLS